MAVEGELVDRLFPDGETALLLLHLQNEVLDPRGLVGAGGAAAAARDAGLVDVVAQAQDAADAAGALTVHVVFQAPNRTCTSTAPVLREGAEHGFVPRTWATQVVPDLRRPSLEVFGHDTMSAFAGNSLAARLRSSRVRRVLLGGVSTHLVVAASAFAAADEGFRVVVLADGCASPRPGAHSAALAQLAGVAQISSVRATTTG